MTYMEMRERYSNADCYLRRLGCLLVISQFRIQKTEENKKPMKLGFFWIEWL